MSLNHWMRITAAAGCAMAIGAGCRVKTEETIMRERPLKGQIGDTTAFHALHPAFEKVFEFLRTVDRTALTPEKTALDGDRIYYFYSNADARPADAALLEAHRRYIDVQYVLSGHERMGWRRVDDCASVKEPYDESRDFMLFSDPPAEWIDVGPGEFAVFFPDDAHAPLVGTGKIEKIVVKIAVQ